MVLPHGFRPPEERLGYERFAFCEKGMVRQRVFAINDAKTPYVLLLDDDVEFEPQYVEKIFTTMVTAEAQCCIPILKEEQRRRSLLKEFVYGFIGCKVFRRMNDGFYIKINSCGGSVFNSDLELGVQYYSQTGHGSNCFAETQALRGIRFEDELWLEDSGYPLPEDQVMFYKLYKSGVRIAVCRDAYFKHLDAGAASDGNRYLKTVYAQAGNFLIFWYRFIFSEATGFNKITSVVSIVHRLFWESVLNVVQYHNISVCKAVLSGLKHGLAHIKMERSEKDRR